MVLKNIILILFVIILVFLVVKYNIKNKFNNKKYNFILLISKWTDTYSKFKYNNVTIDKFNNKINSYYMCKNLKIPVPQMYYYGNYNQLNQSVFYNDAFVIKPINGSSSKGIMPLIRKKNNYVNLFTNKVMIKNDIDTIYNNINVIIEEFVLDKNSNYSIPDDYKFFCFKGKLEFLKHRYFNDKTQKYYFNYYDMNWKPLGINLEVPNEQIMSKPVEKPKNFEKMKKYCKIIASNVFPEVFVRLDFYLNLDEPVFGEVTPQPLGGLGYSNKGIKFLDNLCKKHDLK